MDMCYDTNNSGIFDTYLLILYASFAAVEGVIPT